MRLRLAAKLVRSTEAGINGTTLRALCRWQRAAYKAYRMCPDCGVSITRKRVSTYLTPVKHRSDCLIMAVRKARADGKAYRLR